MTHLATIYTLVLHRCDDIPDIPAGLDHTGVVNTLVRVIAEDDHRWPNGSIQATRVDWNPKTRRHEATSFMETADCLFGPSMSRDAIGHRLTTMFESPRGS